MNFNINQIAAMQKLKSCLEKFTVNHPKFPLFLRAVTRPGVIEEGTVIEVKVTTKSGQEYCSNIKLNTDDMEAIALIRELQEQK